jgi:hypothetical protein
MKLLSAALISLALVGGPALAETPKISKVEVEVDLDAMKNARAAQYWGHLQQDLAGAITARLADNIGKDGSELKVDVNAVELANGFEEHSGVADTRMTAHVIRSSDNAIPGTKVFDLSVDVNSAMVLMPVGTDIAALTWDTPDLYQAMVQAFADSVVKRLD